MSDEDEPVLVKISDIYPSGRTLIDHTRAVMEDVARITETLLAVQDLLLPPVIAPYTVLSGVRQTRWACCSVWKRFESIIDASYQIAVQALSIAPSATTTQALAIFSSIGAKSDQLFPIIQLQRHEIDDLAKLWTSAVPRFDDPFSSSSSKQAKNPLSSLYLWLAKLLKIRESAPPPLSQSELKALSSTLESSLAQLKEHYNTLFTFWKDWSAGPPEVWAKRKTVLSEPGWLESEWNVTEELEGLRASAVSMYEKLRKAEPAFRYPLP